MTALRAIAGSPRCGAAAARGRSARPTATKAKGASTSVPMGNIGTLKRKKP